MKGTFFHLYSKPKFLLFIVLLGLSLSAHAQFSINAESGAIFTQFNDISKGENGTLISLKNDIPSPVGPFYRLRASYLLKDKHFFSVLYAPLKLTLNGNIGRAVQYDGKTFAANTPIEAVYKFNSYRLTYNNRLVGKERFNFGVGFSAKIRDAGSSFKNATTYTEDFSYGFVPLLNIIADWQLSEKAGIAFFGDGVVASRGRAVDLSITGTYQLNKHLQSAIGYRFLDGGADANNTYNYVRFHFATASVTYMF
jgi:hypothetical protein